MTQKYRFRYAILSIFILFATPVVAEEKENEDFVEALKAAKQRDLPYAIEIWRDLADRGHSKSQYHLGVLYRKGLGVKKDLDKAYMWFRRAAEKGHPMAQYNLGVMYEKGWGTTRNLQEAETWYRRAAKKDVVMAKEKIKNSVE